MNRRLHTTRLLRAEEAFGRTASELIRIDAETHGPALSAWRAAGAAADAARRAERACDPQSRVIRMAETAQESAAVARETKILAGRAATMARTQDGKNRLEAMAGKAARAECRAAAAANRALRISVWISPLRAAKAARVASAAAANALEVAQRTLSAVTETQGAARKSWMRRGAASRHVLGMAAGLLPASQRDRWREEWVSQLSEKATRLERANWSLSLLLNGAPRMAVSLRRKVSRTIR